jgi:lysophospholipase L1-like esterase
LPTRTDFISDESIRDVNKSLKEIAEDAGAEYLDIYGLFIDADGMAKKDYLLEDGVHLSDKGYAVWARAVDEIINQ